MPETKLQPGPPTREDSEMTHNEICNSLKRWVEFMYDQPDVDKMVITISKHDLSGYKVDYEIRQCQEGGVMAKSGASLKNKKWR